MQDPIQREEVNVARVLESTERLLRAWSLRRLTLLGKILIIKTFAVSQSIYLMQTMLLSTANHAKIMKLIFKFLWNKNFNAARAPERIRRSVMLAPVESGGCGLVDIKDLGHSLDVRSYGRLLTSNHPFLKQVKSKLGVADFFNITTLVAVDGKLKASLKSLNEGRRQIFQWPTDEILRNLNLCLNILNIKLKAILNATGKRSLHYFVLHRRVPDASLRQLSAQEFNNLQRFIIYPDLCRVIRRLIGINLPINGSLNALEAFPAKDRSVTNVTVLSSKQIRLLYRNAENCALKIGTLTPGELLSWTRKIKKLTSTRHKNIMLRVVHGDIFSNSRLHRFGLRDNPACSNCPEPVESILHRIAECPKAITTWDNLEQAKRLLNLTSLTDKSVENLIGAKERLNKIELALQAEVLLRLTSKGEGYCPNQLIKAAIALVLHSENLNDELRNNFERYKAENW